jgi:sugar lactone lactonase YvrE
MHIRKTCLSLLLLSVMSALTGCMSSSTTAANPDAGPTPGPDAGGGDDAGECPTTGTGTLSVESTGLPAGAAPSVSIDGAAATSLSVSLPGGTHTVTAADVVVADTIVRSVYHATITGSPACVKNGETTTVQVDYQRIPTSNALWALNANGAAEVLGFRADSIRASGSPAADVSTRIAIPSDFVFDKDGGVWTTADKGGTRQLVHFPASLFAASSTTDITPDIVIDGASLNEGAPAAAGMAFDAQGNLWVTAPAAGKINRFAKADLAASGSPQPGVVISSLHGVNSIAFDKTGNLWANDDANHVVEYVAARLAASTAAAPDVLVGAQSGGAVVTPYQAPTGLAFDKDDNLWVDFNGGDMIRLTTAERSATATATPAVQIHIDVLALASNMAFDESGGMWFAYTAGKIARFAPEQLAATGTVAPSTIITSTSLASAGNVALFPAPANLPLYSKR